MVSFYTKINNGCTICDDFLELVDLGHSKNAMNQMNWRTHFEIVLELPTTAS